MRIIKRVLLFPIGIAVGALSVVFRLLSNIFAYVIGAVMLLGLAAGVYMVVEQCWEGAVLVLCLEVGGFTIQFIWEILILGINYLRDRLKYI